MEKLFDVVSVEPRDDNSLLLVFENQEKRRFDMTPFLSKKPFVKINNSPLFMKAKVAYGTVVWPGNIDIAPETLWDCSQPV
ncbi:MAG: DUF2442 domain-containing protein [Chitinispirillaceae bacterium]|nr:DUF2442 domain-containing protein [Chitinispirillaceae bacterium]